MTSKTRPSATHLALLLSLLLGTIPAVAIAGLSDEAARQLELAEEDLEAGNFERAAASAASALRLDPALHAALVTRGLALRGLGRTDDAGALLRAYRDLRGSLPLDERVEPALAQIEAEELRESVPAKAATAATEAPVELPVGPLVVVYGPGTEAAASEAAYAAARPFLGGQPAAAALPLSAAINAEAGALLVLGAPSTGCAAAQLGGTLEEQLDAAEAQLLALEPQAAIAALDASERHLACGGGAPRAAVTRLLAARAHMYWLGGEPERASALWLELFTLDPERPVDSELDPTAQALQLDAKARAAERPATVEVALTLPSGWSAAIDGAPAAAPQLALPAGRRIVRLTGPAGETLGAVVELARDAVAVIGLGGSVVGELYGAAPPAAVLKFAAEELLQVAEREQAIGVLLVNLGERMPTVRRFDRAGSFILTGRVSAVGAARGRGTPSARAASPPVGSVVLLGGGLAATAIGVIVAAVGHKDGEGLVSTMGTVDGYANGYADYEGARAQERVGVGIALGGGVVAAVGAVTFVIPRSHRPEGAR